MEESKKNDEKPGEFEKKFVYGVYEKIAPHFSATRYQPWPKVQQFLNELEVGALVADVGCGNGKYLGLNNENIFTVNLLFSITILPPYEVRDGQVRKPLEMLHRERQFLTGLQLRQFEVASQKRVLRLCDIHRCDPPLLNRVFINFIIIID